MSGSPSRNLAALQRLFRDYVVQPQEICDVLSGRRASAGHITAERAFVRMLERAHWYEIVAILGIARATELLSEKTVRMVRLADVRGRRHPAGPRQLPVPALAADIAHRTGGVE